MEVSEDKLEAGSLPRGNPAVLVQCPVAIQDVLDPNAIEVSSQQEANVIVVLRSDVVYCMYNMVD